MKGKSLWARKGKKTFEMELTEKIQADLKEALKAGEKTRVSTLRFLLSAIHNKEIALSLPKGQGLKDEEVLGILQTQIKQRKESIMFFKQGNRDDLVAKEQAELDILSKYLPQQLSEEEVKKIITEAAGEVGAKGLADFGKVMGAVMPRLRGKTEGDVVAGLVKEHLSH